MRENVLWFYGCSGPWSLPTLGVVHFAVDGRVATVIGVEGTPPSPKTISEGELRQAMVILDQMPGVMRFNPATLVKVVNELIPFGKVKVLAAMAEYERVISLWYRPEYSREWKPISRTNVPAALLAYEATDHAEQMQDLRPSHRLIPVIRLLFTLTPAEQCRIPRLWIGNIWPKPPDDPRDVPYFPLALIGDVPVLQFFGINLGGSAGYNPGDTPKGLVEGKSFGLPDELQFFRQYGRMRKRPLLPSGKLIEVLAAIEKSPQWLLTRPAPVKENGVVVDINQELRAYYHFWLKTQLLAAITPLYPATLEPNGAPIDVKHWDAIMADVKSHPISWNPVSNRYERRGRRTR
jgi:hypothetical protein